MHFSFPIRNHAPEFFGVWCPIIPPIGPEVKPLELGPVKSARTIRDLAARFTPLSDSVAGYTHSRTSQEVIALAQLLESQKWMTGNFALGFAQVTPQGFIRATESNVVDSVTGFIAMWFDRSMDTARLNGLEPAIRAAGSVVSSILTRSTTRSFHRSENRSFLWRTSPDIVGAFISRRALQLGLPVFWTCRKDHLAQLHFDIRQYNCIDWMDEPDLAKRLQRRIEAVIGRGPVKQTDAG